MPKVKRDVTVETVEKNVYYTTGEFLGVLEAAGLPSSRSWFNWAMENDKLPTQHFKRFTRNGNRRIKGDVIIAIVSKMRAQ